MRKFLLASAATLLSAGAALAQPATPVAAPGTIVVHLNGYFQYSIGAYGATNMGSTAAGYKLNNVGTAGDFRFYPGFDAQTANGIWYGAQVEIRTLKANAGNGKNNNSTSTSSTSASSGFSGLYVQRAYGYIGTPDYGFVRFGQTDSAFSLSQVGVIESFGDGSQFNADGGENLMLPSAPSPFIYSDASALYSTDKIVYESPAVDVLAGKLSGIIGFEPNSNGIKQGYANVATAYNANANSVAGGSANRRRNTFDASVSYANKLNGFANKVSVSYLHGSPLGSTNGVYPTRYGYNELSVFQAGAQTTYAGLTVGGNIKTGQVNGNYAFKPRGGRNALGYIVGASYVNGPYTVGASYFNEQSAGAWTGSSTAARTLSDYGVAAGANYALAKPLSLWVQYEYGHQHQPTATTTGNIQEQVVAIGTTIKW